MATWYFTNQYNDSDWSNNGNWNSQYDGDGTSPGNIPWTTSDTAADDIAPGYNCTYFVDLNLSLGSGFTITGTCSLLVRNLGTIFSGNWVNAVSLENPGVIIGGTFSGFVSSSFSGAITGGTFTNGVSNDLYSQIYGGTFSGSVYNGSESYIYGGTFSGSDFYNDFYSTISGGTFTGSGTIYGYAFGIDFSGGSYALYYLGAPAGAPYCVGVDRWRDFHTGDGYTVSEVIEENSTSCGYTPPVPDNEVTTWYFTGNGDGSSWDDPANWSATSNGLGQNPVSAPWTTAATKDANLVGSNSYVELYSPVGNGFTITGTCSLNGLQNYGGTIYGGTFTGSGFYNGYNGTIYGGTFTGSGFYNGYGIYGGTFTGIGFTNGDFGAYINGGAFTGSGFTNSGYINGGTFSGNSFTNSSYAYITDGTFSGSGFANYGYINGGTFSGNGFTNSSYAYINGGTFTRDVVSLSLSGSEASLSIARLTFRKTVPQLDVLGSGFN